MRIHILGLAHTVVDPTLYSTCAFTMKIRTLVEMLILYGWEVIEYSNEGSVSCCTRHVPILSRAELQELSQRGAHELYNVDLDNHTLQATFQKRLIEAVTHEVGTRREIVAHVFGPNIELMQCLPNACHVETGIGYENGIRPNHITCPFRIFESHSWLAFHAGGQGRTDGNNYEYVIPNAYRLSEWPVSLSPTPRMALYFGRKIIRKGMHTLCAIAKAMPDWQFLLVGQEDEHGTNWGADLPNLVSLPPVYGRERAELIGRASVMLCPTLFREPFCGSAAEAMLCGTPVVATAYGVFPERIQEGRNGYMCHTLADWTHAIRQAVMLDRQRIAQEARERYGTRTVGRMYHEVLQQIDDVWNGNGWYTSTCRRNDLVKLDTI